MCTITVKTSHQLFMQKLFEKKHAWPYGILAMWWEHEEYTIQNVVDNDHAK